MNAPYRKARAGLSRVRRAARSRLSGPDDASKYYEEWTAPIAPADPSTGPGPTIVLLNDCHDQINFGANALVEGLTAVLSRAVPSATIIPIPSHWLIEKTYYDGFVSGGARLRQPQARFPGVADEFEPVADEWLAGNGGPDVREYLDRFAKADVVLLNGEGSIYRTNQSAIRELFLAWFCKVRLGIPTAFVNGTIHLTGVVPVLPAMVRKTFAVLDAVAVREPYSFRNLQEFAPHIDAQLFPDPAFVFTPDDALASPAVDAIRAQIGDAPYFCFDPGTMPNDHRSPSASAVHELVRRLQHLAATAVFVNSGPADNYIREIARQTGSLYVDSIVDFREYMALVAGARFSVTGRYHNAILAAIMGCPSITFGSTSFKVHGACELLDDLLGSPYDSTDLRSSIDAIEAQARGYLADRDSLSTRLQDVCRRRGVEAFHLGDVVTSVLARSPAPNER